MYINVTCCRAFSAIGELCFVFDYSPEDVSMTDYNVTLQPDSLKQSIELTNYPWSTKNTSLALQIVVGSVGAQSIVQAANRDGDRSTGDDQAQIRMQGAGNVKAAYFSWTSRVMENATAGLPAAIVEFDVCA
jgi:hypothetical protein